jgi:palmitoyl-protein thioesterase
MIEFADMIRGIYPGIFIHLVYLEEDLKADRKATFFGNVDAQIDFVAEQLAEIEELQGGFDAMGFSQGGQFLRAFVERYNSPPVFNLITFGSQHMGISDIPECRPADLICKLAQRITKSAVYGSWAQDNLVQAQYFRDPRNYAAYLAANSFLTSVNNEIPEARNSTYARNFASLQTLVLAIFSEDKTVVPKESAWFGSEAIPGQEASTSEQQPLNQDKDIIPMRLQPLYTEDWIGLRTLDERGVVFFETCKGEHMRIGECWERIVKQFVGGSL